MNSGVCTAGRHSALSFEAVLKFPTRWHQSRDVDAGCLFDQQESEQFATVTRPTWLKGVLAVPLGSSCHWLSSLPHTLVHTPVVASQRVRMDTFCARLSQFTATLVLVAHFTIVM